MSSRLSAPPPTLVRNASLALVGLFVTASFFFPTRLHEHAQQVFHATITHMGWLYLLATFGFVVLLGVLALGRTGDLRLGKEGVAPSYGYWSWIAMLFSAGMGVGLVFWGVAEPMVHFLSPAHGAMEPGSAEAARDAIKVSVFHWGVHQWSNYALVALAIAWMRFRMDAPGLMSRTLEPLLGERRTKRLGPWIDVPAVVATTFGVATTLGFGILQINGGLNALAGVPISVVTQAILMALITGAFLWSATTGLNRGILQLSRLNMVLAVVLAVAVFVLGPTTFLLQAGTQALGDYLDDFITMSLRTGPWIGSTWSGEWTVFYWAWGLSWAPFVGTFIARVSEGRTVREFVTGVMIVPALLSLVWFTIFGGSALHQDMHADAGIAEATAQDSSLALFALFESLPLTGLLGGIALVLIVIFLVTSADSASYVLGMFTENGTTLPSLQGRLIQGVLLAMLCIALLSSGGMEALRTIAITVTLPFLMVLLLMAASLWRALRGAVEEADEAASHRTTEHP